MEGREGDPSPRHPSGQKPAPQQQGGRTGRGGHRAPGRPPRRHGGEGVREKPRPLRPGPGEGGCHPPRGAPRERPRPGPARPSRRSPQELSASPSPLLPPAGGKEGVRRERRCVVPSCAGSGLPGGLRRRRRLPGRAWGRGSLSPRRRGRRRPKGLWEGGGPRCRQQPPPSPAWRAGQRLRVPCE